MTRKIDTKSDTKSLLAVVLTYFPDKTLLLENVNAFIDYVDKVVIWNNTPNDVTHDSCKLAITSDKIIYKGIGENIGISKALNYVWNYAADKGYDYLLTMDQDSVWVNLESFMKQVLAFENKCNIFGPEFKLNECCSIKEGDYRITSGMLIPIKVLNRIGGYCERFLIDGIDVELCYRAKQFGYKTYYVSGATLRHHAGSHLECRFCGYNFISDGYSASRIYEIIRNHVWIYKKYDVKLVSFKYVFKHYYIEMPIKILLGENKKKEKIWAYFKGLFDGLCYGLNTPPRKSRTI